MIKNVTLQIMALLCPLSYSSDSLILAVASGNLAPMHPWMRAVGQPMLAWYTKETGDGVLALGVKVLGRVRTG